MSIVIPRTPFECAVLRYIRHQRALGKLFGHQAWVLERLARHLSGQRARDLDAELFEGWLRSLQHLSGTSRRLYALTVRKFCRHRQRTESRCFVPDPLYFPRRTPSVQPVIVGPGEIARMLERIEGWPANPQHPMYKPTYRIALILLYTAGLRRGELVRLTLNDVDLPNATLCIRESKFHKTRIVPLSSSARRELRRFLKIRLAAPWDISAGAPLLGDQHGSARFHAYVPEGIGHGLRRLFREADIRDPHGRYPRVHDLRHSFAVQALLRWYRAGADVQAKLPQLSIYMGHVSIVSTAHYLHFIPEVAGAAHRLLARHFGAIARGGAR
jgi:integrase/recombinase XerD